MIFKWMNNYQSDGYGYSIRNLLSKAQHVMNMLLETLNRLKIKKVYMLTSTKQTFLWKFTFPVARNTGEFLIKRFMLLILEYTGE